jgi:hypothetical protein
VKQSLFSDRQTTTNYSNCFLSQELYDAELHPSITPIIHRLSFMVLLRPDSSISQPESSAW